jgi:hemolysin D
LPQSNRGASPERALRIWRQDLIKDSGDANDAAADKKDDQRDKGTPSYIARVALDGATMTVDGRQEPLRPGMAITAEIKTGSRRILDYLLSPLRQYAQDAIKER